MGDMGLSKEDKELVKTIKQVHRENAPEVLRSLEQKRKPLTECTKCVRTEDITYPLVANICRNCIENICKRYGKIHILRKVDFIIRNPCDLCGTPARTHFTINIRLCPKCMKHFGKHHSGEFRDANDRYRKRIKSFARVVA